MNQDLNTLLNEVAASLKPAVEKIEAGAPATQNHYGAYMGLIAQMGKSRTQQLAMAIALKRAGANSRGVDAACKVMDLI